MRSDISLEALLKEVFFIAAEKHNPTKLPDEKEVEEVAKLLADTMREMKLTIIPLYILEKAVNGG